MNMVTQSYVKQHFNFAESLSWSILFSEKLGLDYYNKAFQIMIFYCYLKLCLVYILQFLCIPARNARGNES